MERRLSAAQVAELAELLEDTPVRAGLVEKVLDAAEAGRGMTLRLQGSQRLATDATRAARRRKRQRQACT